MIEFDPIDIPTCIVVHFVDGKHGPEFRRT